MKYNDEKNLEKCKALALRYITAQLKTEGQVKEYLKRKSFEEEHIELSIDFLKEYNYLNDKEYCLLYYREACRKGKGRRRIEQELLAKKIKNDIIKDALDQYATDDNPDYEELIEEVGTERERALNVGRKMLRQHLELGKEADKNFMAKVGRRLMSLGYDSQILYSVIGTLMKEGKCLDDEY
ncbi:MAG: regulatory protein RecX [Firmicutes bacterium]|nr:regulatory protein RecX [Bacillota bacterium]